MDCQAKDKVMNIGGEQDIVIVGGGICGLATALALHRKGIRSMVLERSESLRAAGVGIIMQPNGWRALDQLGVAPKLRQTCIEIPSGLFIAAEKGKFRESELPLGKGELRCLKRMELMKALAEALPSESVRLGCRVVSIVMDPLTFDPVLQLHDGTLIKAKIVIGCDGVNSIISKFVGVNSQSFSPEVRREGSPITKMAKFRKGTVVVAGDAMHAMCPFISQGGGESLEDAVVLARCLSEMLQQAGNQSGERRKMLIEEALGMYVKERRMRVFWLSLQTYLIVLTLDRPSKVKRALGIAGLILVFGDQKSHTDYDCGRL